MSVIGSNILAGASGQGSGYNISRSVRLRSSASANLNRTYAGTGTSATTKTLSMWVKRGSLGSAQRLANSLTAAAATTFLRFDAGDTLTFQFEGASAITLTTTQVFRDPSAWYHIVLAIDTTQATAANRVKLYVNGSQITSFGTTNYPAQNATTTFMGYAGASNRIGSIYDATSEFFDGYLTEINHVDGQALTPSSFGSTNSTTGVWQPIKYTGTYGTNGFYLPFSVNSTSTYAGSFNGSNQYIGLPSNAAFAFTTGAFTAECWFNSTVSAGYQQFIDFWSATSGSYTVGQWQLGTDNAGHLQWTVATSSTSAGNITITSTATYNINTWNHVAVVRNGTTVTIYLNGVSVATTTFSGTIGASTITGSLGRQTTGSAYLSGYLSNARITNNAVYNAAFTPPSSPLTAVSGTQLLTLQNSTLIDNSANALTLTNGNSVAFSVQYPFTSNIGADASGNNNNWTPNNISLVNGVTYDSMTDVPTLTSATAANFSVMNAVWKGSSATITDGNLTLSSNGNIAIASIPISSGQWYCEWTQTNSVANLVGIIPSTQAPTIGYPGQISGTYGYSTSGSKYNSTSTAYGATWTTNDVIGIAYDASAGTLTFYKNGASQGTAYSGLSGEFLFAAGNNAGSATTGVFNFGQRPFAYTPPSGFVALNTYNLPTSTIVNGATVMAASTYTGTGASQAIVNSGNNTGAVSFKPDFVWNKSRSNAYGHALYDSVRGVDKYLMSNNTNAEATLANSLNSFDAGGFTMGGQDNLNGATYVAWQWQAGQGSTSSNTNGSITSTVSVNATAGFSVVTYTGTGANATVGHGLGVAPKMIIVKNRSAVTSWRIYQAYSNATPQNYTLYFDTSAATAESAAWNNTAPTSSVFSVGTNNSASTNNYVAYCWSEIAGYSKFGSYTGNGSADGVFVFLGFRPRLVMYKRTDTVANWVIWDTSRNTYNVVNNYLLPNSSAAEGVLASLDILSNGFKLRTTNADNNGSGGTFIYAAFAENPFKNALAR